MVSFRSVSVVVVWAHSVKGDSLGFEDPPDFTPETFQVDLDLEPERRWDAIVARKKAAILKAFKAFEPVLAPKLREVMVLMHLERYFPKELEREVKGIADALGLSAGYVAVVQIVYESMAHCSSVVMEDRDGRIVHGRNLDFPYAQLLREITVNTEFTSRSCENSVCFRAVTFAGFVGVTTGYRPGKLGVSFNQRMTSSKLGANLLQVLRSASEGTQAQVSTFFLRDLLSSGADYETALRRAKETPLIAPMYIILSGVSAGQGAVVTRWRRTRGNVWSLGDTTESKDGWRVLVTNSEPWLEKPLYHDRFDVEVKALDALAPSNRTADALYDILGMRKPCGGQRCPNNSMTIFTAIMVPASNSAIRVTVRGTKFQNAGFRKFAL